jgi:holliday junction DNA helicase RuvA
MIGQLTGLVLADEADGTVLLDVKGVGYELLAPLGTVARARAVRDGAPGDPIMLHVHTHVREDALQLFGFATATDKAAFRALISVSNVGPRIALSVLSAMPAGELSRAVAKKDVARLVSVPGIGKKTAERLMLELKDKLALDARAETEVRQAGPGPSPSTTELLTSALTRMGYRPNEAERAILHLAGRVDTEPLQTLIREALVLLAR